MLAQPKHEIGRELFFIEFLAREPRPQLAASAASGRKRMAVRFTASPRRAMRFFKPSKYSGLAADEVKASPRWVESKPVSL
ncbi:MAG: hypothetical protein ABSF95_21520 [Verrucomicrobiota bacterium]